MTLYNQTVLAQLPTVAALSAECYLIEYNQDINANQRLWSFLYNPQSLDFSRSASYSESQTLGAKKQDLQYGYTVGRTLSIPELILDSWCKGKSIQPLLDGIEALLEADLKNKRYSPPILSFVFGSRRFGPCVLSEVSWKESAWLGGSPARAVMSLKLLEVPEPQTRSKSEKGRAVASDRVLSVKHSLGEPRMPLTERQLKEASDEAIKVLKSNISFLPSRVQALVISEAYKLSTNRETGDVTMFEGTGKKLGTVGRYDGTKLVTSGFSDLIKK